MVPRQGGKGLSEEAAFDLKNKKLPRRDLEEKCPKQQCSEGSRLGKRACSGSERRRHPRGGAEVREMHGLAEWKGKGILINGTGELGE